MDEPCVVDILENGINGIALDVNLRGSIGRTSALHEAVRNDNSEIVSLLVAEDGINLNIMNSGEYAATPLLNAVALNSHNMIRLLLEAGADPNTARLPDLRTPLHEIVVVGYDFGNTHLMFRPLVEAGAAVNGVDEDSVTPLMLAVEKNDLTLVELFLAEGADANSADNKGRKVLGYLQIDANDELIYRSVIHCIPCTPCICLLYGVLIQWKNSAKLLRF